MKVYSFSLNPKTLNDFKKLFPANKTRDIMKNYLLKEYVLPDSLETLKRDDAELNTPTLPESNQNHYTAIQPYWMSDGEISKVDHLIKQADDKGYKLNRSLIIENVMDNLIDIYKDNPIKTSKQHRQIFKVPAGTKKRLAKLIEKSDLTYGLSTFIMDGYIPSNEFESVRNMDQEDFDFYTDIEVFDQMDQFAAEYGFKRGGRAKIFRDALSQYERSMQANSPRKAALQRELKYLLDEYKKIEEKPIIKEQIIKYLSDEN